MPTPAFKPWMPRLAAFGVALLLAASVVFWLLRWPVREPGNALPSAVSSEDLPAASNAAVARLLGAPADPAPGAALPDAASRFQLAGIVSLGGGHGAALLSVDGQPPKPYRMGSRLLEGWVLQSVQPRSVALGADLQGPARLTLELPPRQP